MTFNKKDITSPSNFSEVPIKRWGVWGETNSEWQNTQHNWNDVIGIFLERPITGGYEDFRLGTMSKKFDACNLYFSDFKLMKEDKIG